MPHLRHIRHLLAEARMVLVRQALQPDDHVVIVAGLVRHLVALARRGAVGIAEHEGEELGLAVELKATLRILADTVHHLPLKLAPMSVSAVEAFLLCRRGMQPTGCRSIHARVIRGALHAGKDVPLDPRRELRLFAGAGQAKEPGLFAQLHERHRRQRLQNGRGVVTKRLLRRADRALVQA